ncbi:uncharacterized protein [Panulirus ornatus]|uniref:uncharacterized protein n=1 Tax=Panulirus ornatus TaxID=150431 RepID=UPI003A8B955C
MSEECNKLKIEQGDGARLRALKDAVNHILERLLGGWKASLFVKSFPTFAKQNGPVLEAIRASLVDTVSSALYEDISSIIDEDVAGSLERLGNLVKNYSGPKDVQAWRPSGNPSLDIRAHDAKVLQYEKQRLLESVEAAKKTSDELVQEVETGRKRCHDNHVEIQKRFSALNELVELSRSIPKDKMISFHHHVVSNEGTKMGDV